MRKLVLAYANQRWLKTDLTTTWDLNPTTLLLLAAMVQDVVEVEIVDAQFHDLSPEEFTARIAALRPDFVGISLLTSEYHATLVDALALVKGVDAGIVTIAGGVHVTTLPEYVLRHTRADYCVIGDGEHTLRALILFLIGAVDHLPEQGIAYRDGARIVNRGRALVKDLSALPWPRYDLVEYSAYLQTASRAHGANRPPAYPYVRLVTTRGCSFGCTFCQVGNISGTRTRARSPEDVVAELSFLKERYGIRAVIFDDDNMLMAKGYAPRLFRAMIDARLDLQWIGTAFALFLLNPQILRLMRESGCVGINVAVESGSERVLRKIVKKPIKDLAKVPGIIQMIKDEGMWVVANFIIGFVGETWEEIRQTVRFAEHCGADYVKFFNAIPLHNTKLFEMARAAGALSLDDDLKIYDWRYSHIQSDEWTQRDIAVLRAYEWDRINFAPARIDRVAEIWGLPPDEIRRVSRKTRDALDL